MRLHSVYFCTAEHARKAHMTPIGVGTLLAFTQGRRSHDDRSDHPHPSLPRRHRPQRGPQLTHSRRLTRCSREILSRRRWSAFLHVQNGEAVSQNSVMYASDEESIWAGVVYNRCGGQIELGEGVVGIRPLGATRPTPTTAHPRTGGHPRCDVDLRCLNSADEVLKRPKPQGASSSAIRAGMCCTSFAAPAASTRPVPTAKRWTDQPPPRPKPRRSFSSVSGSTV